MADIRSLLQPLLDHPAMRAACRVLGGPESGVYRSALRGQEPTGDGAPLALRAPPSTRRYGAPEGGALTLSGLTRPAKALVIAGLAHRVRRPLVVLTSDNEAAEAFRETTSAFLSWLDAHAGAAVHVLPAPDCSPYEGRSVHAEILEQRAVTLWNLADRRTQVIFVPLPAALARFRDRSYYASLAIELKVGAELNPEDLVKHLLSVGYEPGEPVWEVGQFSVRGGIVDVFPPESEYPFRLEFFGDQIESLREFDPTTQRSRKPAPAASLLPLSETRRDTKFFQALIRHLAERVPKRRPAACLRRQAQSAPSPELSSVGDPACGTAGRAVQLPTGAAAEQEPEWAPDYSHTFPGWEFFAPLVEPYPCTLLSLLDQPVLVWDEPLDRKGQLKRTLEGLAANFEEVRDIVPPRPKPEDIFLTEQEFLKAFEGIPQLYLKELAVDAGVGPPLGPAYAGLAEASLGPTTESEQGAPLPTPNPDFVLLTQPSPKFRGGLKTLAEDLQERLAQRESIIVVVPTSGKVDRLQEILTEYRIPFGMVTPEPEQTGFEPPPGSLEAGGVVLIAPGKIAEGLVIPELRQAWLADRDLFGSIDWHGRGRRERSGVASFVADMTDLKVGDYVVHVDHGIGLYQGLRQLSVEGTLRDFLLLTYQEDAKLYVPLERLDLVEKYRSGGNGAKPSLHRLGGTTWERTKKRVKRALRDMAQELLQLYAERKMCGGLATGPDTPWQKEFEDAFEFEETPDQLAAMAEIRHDLESPEPMDRLLCGDVGYGKTELAMRAAFKLVQESRQVVVLAPTTVLAFQHHSTFRQRVAPFPVRVEMLSRFRSRAEQKKILEDTETGKVDILVGTHRLLSSDVRFRDLGLLIVDEEQRFGVAAKEKLKKLKAGVDVLTMSATPIPRTLHMSLGGLRDLSVIETPPLGRLAIQTTVAAFNQGLVQAAILQEMQRQGQVFFVHNRVESIFSMAALIQRLVPTARIGVAHGQMKEKELEKVMLKFVQGEYDVLAATALIENGLDIPRANTLIVNHADRFGLADLYQLRGRVGRSNRRAYAYFLVPAEESLTPAAKRRLAALQEFSDLGAGFRLAALDLELRGAGNLLGREQHGHLSAVGIDLYLRMLEQTVEELKGAPRKIEVRTTLNLGLDIKIPDSYIADEHQRLRMYKRISGLATPEARADLEAELVDRFGPIPPSVANLLDYALLKSRAERLLIQSIERRADEISMRFHAQAPVDPQKLTQFVRDWRDARLRPEGILRFRLPSHFANPLVQVQNVLQELYA